MHAAADPLMFLYVPVGQGAQGPPVGPKKPAAQVQLANEVLPAGAWELRGHGIQVSEKKVASPVELEKKPGPHLGIHFVAPV